MIRYQALILLSILLVLVACKENSESAPTSDAANCRGVYYLRDSQGALKKFNEYYNASAKACYTDTLSLSQWEKTSEAWTKNKVQCVPQPQFASRTLVSANNFYAYRDGRSFLDLESSAGIFRRIVLGESKAGTPTFTRLQGCFYQRSGQGVDSIFGNQILLDTEISKIKSSEVFDPWEIFQYTELANSLEMTRFDASGDWDYTFCPESLTPWGYCDLLRNGNIYYYPNLTSSQMTAILGEALLIRRQFNFSTTAKSNFEALWTSVESTHTESGRNNWKYMVNGLVDTPPFVDQAWRAYIMGNRPHMPDVGSGLMRPLCYEGTREIILSDGSKATITGEICYENGVYTFVSN